MTGFLLILYQTQYYNFRKHVLRFASTIGDMNEVINTLLQYSESTLFVALHTGKMKGSVPMLITVRHVQLFN